MGSVPTGKFIHRGSFADKFCCTVLPGMQKKDCPINLGVFMNKYQHEGSDCSTMAKHAPYNPLIEKLWVQIPPVAGYFIFLPSQ